MIEENFISQNATSPKVFKIKQIINIIDSNFARIYFRNLHENNLVEIKKMNVDILNFVQEKMWEPIEFLETQWAVYVKPLNTMKISLTYWAINSISCG